MITVKVIQKLAVIFTATLDPDHLRTQKQYYLKSFSSRPTVVPFCQIHLIYVALTPVMYKQLCTCTTSLTGLPSVLAASWIFNDNGDNILRVLMLSGWGHEGDQLEELYNDLH